jgi:hypothetical protein
MQRFIDTRLRRSKIGFGANKTEVAVVSTSLLPRSFVPAYTLRALFVYSQSRTQTMRLLKYDDFGNISFTKDLSDADLPKYKYAILSHMWGPDEEEVCYDDVIHGNCTSKPGIGSEKIRFCIQQTR